MTAAVFFDRDGTLIKPVHYLSDPAGVELIRGAADALVALRAAGYLLVLVTNQAAVGRGILSVEGLRLIQSELDRQLEARGASLDAWYFCPHVGATQDREAVEYVDRKPGPGMLLRASQDLDLELSQSWMVGDMLSDSLAGRNAGCRSTVLVRTGGLVVEDEVHPSVDYVVDSVAQLPALILGRAQQGW